MTGLSIFEPDAITEALDISPGVKLMIDVIRDALVTLLTGEGVFHEAYLMEYLDSTFKKCSRDSLLLKPDMIVATEMVHAKTYLMKLVISSQ